MGAARLPDPYGLGKRVRVPLPCGVRGDAAPQSRGDRGGTLRSAGGHPEPNPGASGGVHPALPHRLRPFGLRRGKRRAQRRRAFTETFFALAFFAAGFLAAFFGAFFSVGFFAAAFFGAFFPAAAFFGAGATAFAGRSSPMG